MNFPNFPGTRRGLGSSISEMAPVDVGQGGKQGCGFLWNPSKGNRKEKLAEGGAGFSFGPKKRSLRWGKQRGTVPLWYPGTLRVTRGIIQILGLPRP